MADRFKMRFPNWGLFLFASALLALLSLSTLFAQGGGGVESLPAWGVVPSPNEGAGPNSYLGVEFLSPTDVWAVGDYNHPPFEDPAAHHWDGTMWQMVPLPSGIAGGALLDIDALANDDIWSVGYEGSGGGSLLLHWDGSTWSEVTHPTPFTRQSLNAVSARTANDIWAVGDKSVGGGVSTSYSLHWNGSAWSVVSVPVSGSGYSTLNSVVALAEDNVWAVGDDSGQPAAWRWNGAGWQSVPIPAKGSNTEYYALSALSANEIWAVGEGWDGQIIARWDGAAWSEVPSPANSIVGTLGNLTDIIALASDDVWAIGSGSQNGTFKGVALHWDGTSWTEQSPPTVPLRTTSLLAVDGSSGNLWAVGSAGSSYVTRWNGSAWEDIPSSNVANANNQLEDVAAASGNSAWAVGSAGGDALSLRWNGNAWGTAPVPNPEAIQLRGVATVSEDEAWAVGVDVAAGGLNSQTVAFHWTNGAWQRVTTPNPSGEYVDALYDVAALAPDNVWAVGETGGTGDSSLILNWDGSSWQTVASACNEPLLAIDARSADDIWAVGYDVACHFDGSGWSQFSLPDSPRLTGVHIVAADDVWAVGGVTTCGAKSCSTSPYSARWNGTSWQEAGLNNYQQTPRTLTDVYATGPNDIWAVGTYSIGTAILHNDGSGWTVVPAPDPGSGGALAAISDNGAGGLWSVGSYYGSAAGAPSNTLVLEAPSDSQGSLFGLTGYDNATVIWSGPVTGSTTSNGVPSNYRAGGLPAGSYTVIAAGDGCDPQIATVTVVAGVNMRLDFDLCGVQPTPVPTATPPATPMVFDPLAVQFNLTQGASATATVEMYNMLAQPMSWDAFLSEAASCAAPSTMSWLDVTPMSGTLPANGVTPLQVTADSSGMGTGSFTGFFCVREGAEVVATLPVTMTVSNAAGALYLPFVAR
ncbi:MAG: hypothetical protein KDD73_06535 [Anaerolineales bacterium]|nr:hypothetical protein [Anaerolineales bacterium]MCB9126808.1 hypothetical protein [Ardenticatenales bacterium]